MAGLVGGDSDSSALTQESGDESVAPTPRESVATGTDAGTEYAEDEEDPRQSPGEHTALFRYKTALTELEHSCLYNLETNHSQGGKRLKTRHRGCSWKGCVYSRVPRRQEEKEVDRGVMDVLVMSPCYPILYYYCVPS